MKIINIKFLGSEYEIKCEDDEVAKIKNLESKLNNRAKMYSKENINFSDTHKLLIVSLSLEDKINDLLANQKKLIEINENLKEKNDKLLEQNDTKELKENLENISKKINIILNKILNLKSE
ncbi:MAG: hypothetical protein CFH22_01049 [Alphaproteobacteria bacterium MarineAlpha5_Bin12]|nr:hypothetical protein [Pelagibacteraceae bacterium]PPR41127.1 MAG: hypothetical protein CFH22_01049 [Alphaproteobacteria bacterium MarineAlpha5_Bin12]|tara:strand:- start:4437 stop:4799 length:363 start_codon:yes stop_codon:yes gene_type:complete